MNMMDLISHLTVKKTPWEQISESDRKSMSVFLLNRWLSMNNELLETIDELQEYTNRLPKEQMYKLYLDVLPKQKIYFKYVKSTKKEKYPKELIETAIKFFMISEREVLEHLEMMSVDDMVGLLKLYGNDDKKIKKIMKSVK